MNRNLSRLASGAVSLVVAAVAGAFAAGPAVAAPLGTVRLSQTSGTVDAMPILASATASASCPAGYGSNALVRVGPPGGPFTNLAKPLSAGNYDKTPVSAKPNRSFTMALGGTPPSDGEWWVVVECFSQTAGMHPDRFVTPITVSGKQWRVGVPAGSTGQPATTTSADPVPAAQAAAGATATADPSGGASVTPRLTGNLRSGSASLANIWWILGLVGVLVVVGIAYLTTRRRPAARPSGGHGKG